MYRLHSSLWQTALLLVKTLTFIELKQLYFVCNKCFLVKYYFLKNKCILKTLAFSFVSHERCLQLSETGNYKIRNLKWILCVTKSLSSFTVSCRPRQFRKVSFVFQLFWLGELESLSKNIHSSSKIIFRRGNLES